MLYDFEKFVKYCIGTIKDYLERHNICLKYFLVIFVTQTSLLNDMLPVSRRWTVIRLFYQSIGIFHSHYIIVICSTFLLFKLDQE